MSRPLTRRKMLRGTILTGIGLVAGARAGQAASPNERLNVACIGAGGRGAVNIEGVARENVVALCDVDEQRAAETFAKYPKARKFRDFRQMFDRMDRQIDAVIVSTPDHTHAVASMAAMRLGKHCYCEKPLTHSIHEARALAALGAAKGLATQMGTQRHCWENHRRIVELIRSGTIGAVRECYVWLGGNRGGGQRPKETPPVPPHLDWDLWLGPAPERPYHPVYAPYGWRFWWDFGTGEMGNLGCHHLDALFEGLSLRYPVSVEAEGPPVHAETTPTWMRVRYEFPARAQLPPVVLTWSHGKKPSGVLPEEELARWRSGMLLVGSKGMLLADLFTWRLLPQSRFPRLEPPKGPVPKAHGFSWEPDSSRHYEEWVAACKTGSPTACHFGYAALLTETVLLANVAYRAGEKLHWDAANRKAVDCAKADAFIERPYRAGWSL